MYLTIYGKPRYLGRAISEETVLQKGDKILIESPRGLEVGVVAGEISIRQEEIYRAIDNRQEGQISNDSGLQDVNFICVASDENIEAEEENRKAEAEALALARQILAQTPNTDMKLVDVEYINDRKKLFLYFTADDRVDFRAYVRDLAKEFRTRIELRQIGIRDEAKVIKGFGSCGKPCCCGYWLQKFMPIGIKMVKEQNLALNPAKISGLCGRLMCCVGYEYDNYKELWNELPQQGMKIRNEDGTYVLTGVDIAEGCFIVRAPTGREIIAPISMFGQFKETITENKPWDNEAMGLDDRGRPLDRKPKSNELFGRTDKRRGLFTIGSSGTQDSGLLDGFFDDYAEQDAIPIVDMESSDIPTFAATPDRPSKADTDNGSDALRDKKQNTHRRRREKKKQEITGNPSDPATNSQHTRSDRSDEKTRSPENGQPQKTNNNRKKKNNRGKPQNGDSNASGNHTKDFHKPKEAREDNPQRNQSKKPQKDHVKQPGDNSNPSQGNGSAHRDGEKNSNNNRHKKFFNNNKKKNDEAPSAESN